MNSLALSVLIGRRDPGLAALAVAWAALAVAALFLRPLWPVDETRYVAVAWEMWQRGDLLVPYLNGEPYSHKPPLLFWLMHAGWALFGVNEWWPRMISPLAGLAGVVMLRRLSLRLWPASLDVARDAAWILFGAALFAGMFTLTMFDVLLLDCVLLGMLGVVQAASGDRRGWLIFGTAMGLGVLTKGPVILLHILPVALAAPWWCSAARREVGPWYRGVAAGFGIGLIIALAWAVPAAYYGGEVYRNAIFWGQTAGRVTESFAHAAPWWAYLPMLPLILFPWFWWPPLWRGFAALRAGPVDPSVRFLLAWLVPTFIAFSLVSGKQAKYLLPLLPAFALLASIALHRLADRPASRYTLLLPALGVAATATVLGVLRAHPDRFDLPAYAASLPMWPAALLLIVAGALVFGSRFGWSVQIRALSGAMLVIGVVLYLGVAPGAAVFADTAPVAHVVAQLQQRGVPVAHLGKYHAQFNFAGRLRKPVDILDERELAHWVADHPDGRVIVMADVPYQGGDAAPALERLFRGGWVQLWEGKTLLRVRSSQ